MKLIKATFIALVGLAMMCSAAFVNPIRAVENSPSESDSSSDNSKSEQTEQKDETKDNTEPNNPEPTTTPTPTTNPEPNNPEPTNPNPDVKPSTPDNPIPPTTTESESKPDNSCLFHPEQDKCKSDNGNCPDGFFQNGHESCVPNHKQCPKGFHSHEDDETGRCIPNSVPCEPGFIRDPDFPTCSSKLSVCRDHPEIRECGGKGGKDHDHNHDHDGNVFITIKNIIHKTSSSSSTLGKNCFDVIKIAWLNKIQRGQNNEVDKFIDKCLGI